MRTHLPLSDHLFPKSVTKREHSDQPVFVQNIPANGEVAQDADGPLAELGGAGGVDPEADGDDGVEIVEGGEITFAIAGSIPEFPDNYGFGQFSAAEDVLQVFTDRLFISRKNVMAPAMPDNARACHRYLNIRRLSLFIFSILYEAVLVSFLV